MSPDSIPKDWLHVPETHGSIVLFNWYLALQAEIRNRRGWYKLFGDIGKFEEVGMEWRILDNCEKLEIEKWTLDNRQDRSSYRMEVNS